MEKEELEKEITKLEELEKLPETIERNKQEFRLFITRYGGYWELSYAKGEYYCDREHLGGDDEYMLLHGIEDKTLVGCIEGMFEFLQKVSTCCEICNHQHSKLNEDGICPDCL